MNRGKSSVMLKVCSYPELTLQWNWKTGNFLLEPSYKPYKPLKLCNRSCLFRKPKCLFQAACTHMKNSDHNKIADFISCFANHLSILGKNKCWFTSWTLVKTFQPEANTTINAKYGRQTKQTFKKCSRLWICSSKSVTQKVVWFSNHVFTIPSQINNLHYF